MKELNDFQEVPALGSYVLCGEFPADSYVMDLLDPLWSIYVMCTLSMSYAMDLHGWIMFYISHIHIMFMDLLAGHYIYRPFVGHYELWMDP